MGPDLNKVAELAKRASDLSCVAFYYCKSYFDICELECVKPLLDRIKYDISTIYAEFLNAGFYNDDK